MGAMGYLPVTLLYKKSIYIVFLQAVRFFAFFVCVCCSGGSAWENILRDLFGIRNRHSFNTLAESCERDPFAPIHRNNGTRANKAPEDSYSLSLSLTALPRAIFRQVPLFCHLINSISLVARASKVLYTHCIPHRGGCLYIYVEHCVALYFD